MDRGNHRSRYICNKHKKLYQDALSFQILQHSPGGRYSLSTTQTVIRYLQSRRTRRFDADCPPFSCFRRGPHTADTLLLPAIFHFLRWGILGCSKYFEFPASLADLARCHSRETLQQSPDLASSAPSRYLCTAPRWSARHSTTCKTNGSNLKRVTPLQCSSSLKVASINSSGARVRCSTKSHFPPFYK